MEEERIGFDLPIPMDSLAADVERLTPISYLHQHNQVVPTGPSFFVLDLHLIEGYSDNEGIGDELCVVPKLCGV